MPLDLSEIVNDADLSEDATVIRSTGAFGLGGWNDTHVSIAAHGIIAPADDQALSQVPEGDRVAGSLQFISAQRIYPTHAGQQAGISDKIQWQGEMYKVQSVAPWVENGFWSAILVRLLGD
jgi:hypothetical protein